jgi:hypothetical protein
MTEMSTSVEAAPVAIVDGTYLCLLPSNTLHDDASNGTSNDGDIVHLVPAVPCTEVWEHCGPRYVNVDEKMMTAMNDDVDGELNADDRILSKIKTIPLRSSDITKFGFRFIHPVNLMDTNGHSGCVSSGTVQVSSCDENSLIMTDERMAWSSNVNNCLHICLPSLTSSSSDEHDFECFEEDFSDVYGDTSCIDTTITKKEKERNTLQSSSSFQICAGGSCLVADFTGIGGYEQALILPQLDADMILECNASFSSDSSSSSTDDELLLSQRKQMLKTILANSILTDGSGVFLPRNAEIQVANNESDTIKFKLNPVNREQLSQHQHGQNQDTLATLSQPKNSSIATQDGQEVESEVERELKSTSVPAKDPAWLEAIEQTIESRLAKQTAESKLAEKTAQVRSDLILKGRDAIHKACRMNHLSSAEAVAVVDPQIHRLRYGTRPRTSSNTQAGLSVVIDLELDIYYPTTTNSASSTTEDVLHDFHVSCTLSPELERGVTADNVCTQSGVVPVLKNGNCITILASISLNELDLDSHTNSESRLDFNIQALWMDARQKRQGSALCTLRLSLDDILFSSPPTPSEQRAGHCIQHEINFAADNYKNSTSTLPVPSAIFDYRQHHTLNIDASGSSSLQDGKLWKDLVTRLNGHIGGSCHIDLYFIKDDPTLKLVIFGSNPTELQATTNFVLRNLPENTKLIEHYPDEAKNLKTLLVSLKNEAEAFQRHRTMSKTKGAVTAEMHDEMTTLQESTDGVASTIKRGWV